MSMRAFSGLKLPKALAIRIISTLDVNVPHNYVVYQAASIVPDVLDLKNKAKFSVHFYWFVSPSIITPWSDYKKRQLPSFSYILNYFTLPIQMFNLFETVSVGTYMHPLKVLTPKFIVTRQTENKIDLT